MYKTVTIQKKILYCDISEVEIEENDVVYRDDDYVISRKSMSLIPKELQTAVFLRLLCHMTMDRGKDKIVHLKSGIWVLENGPYQDYLLYNFDRKLVRKHGKSPGFDDFFHTIKHAEDNIVAWIKENKNPHHQFYFFENGKHVLTLTQEIKINRQSTRCPHCNGGVIAGLGIQGLCPVCGGSQKIRIPYPSETIAVTHE